MLFIGIDDTDTLESRGTGYVARQIAGVLAADYRVLGVTRHQLLKDPRVPCTKKNSAAAILLDGHHNVDSEEVLKGVRGLVLDSCQPGSDPGLCVAQAVSPAILQFGRQVKVRLVTQEEARALASLNGVRLEGLGGDESGVIGALAAVGLAAGGDDGRYVLVGKSRELCGKQPISALLDAGVQEVRTDQGELVQEGLVETDKLRPARRGGVPVAVVRWSGDYWQPLKLD
jgi:tRNA(Ile2) C34 agmatinyltransferase TiaS